MMETEQSQTIVPAMSGPMTMAMDDAIGSRQKDGARGRASGKDHSTSVVLQGYLLFANGGTC
jgi:hypothetical protein